MPVDIYARVSRKGDKDQRSTTSQVAYCRGVLAERGLPEGLPFVDDGRSAWNPRVVRQDWERLMARLESGVSDGVIVFDLERFARRPADGERLIAAAERGLTILDSDQAFDLTTASGKKSFRDAMAAAAYYSDRLSDRVKRGKAAKARAGEVDKRRSFGFEQDGVTLRPDEVVVMRECAQRLLGGETQQSVMADLRDRHVATAGGGNWDYTTFRQVMTRPKNAGLIEHNGAVVGRLPGEPIFDEPTHARLVAMYAARRPGRPPSGKYTLTGFADCECGAPLAGRPVTGTPRKQYWCKTGCHHTFVDAARLDDHIGDWAIRVLSDPAHADVVAATEAAASEARTRLGNEAAAIEGTLTEVAGRLGRQEMSLARHDAICGPLEARLKAIAAEVAGLEAEVAEALPAGVRTLPARDAAWVGWLEVWTDGSPADKRAMVSRALGGKRIVVGPGRAARFDPERVTVA